MTWSNFHQQLQQPLLAESELATLSTDTINGSSSVLTVYEVVVAKNGRSKTYLAVRRLSYVTNMEFNTAWALLSPNFLYFIAFIYFTYSVFWE